MGGGGYRGVVDGSGGSLRRTYPFGLASVCRCHPAASLGRARGFALLLAAGVARLTVVRHRLVRRDRLYVTALFLHS